ncbi:MAG: DHH family phosphoesterase [Phycisphaeraceae bacterium]|nr:DHH family phosphoesterase [Phycisphaeraceae bacterium]
MQGVRRRWTVRMEAGKGQSSLARRLLDDRSGGDERRRRILESPALQDLHRPTTLPGAVAAGEAIARAWRDRRRIAIYGDYDVDGITATALFWHLLRALDPSRSAETYLPHRMEHGYGVNGDALRELADRGVQSVITVDCGITAVTEAELARELGLELIITDHHAMELSESAATELDASADCRAAGSAVNDHGGTHRLPRASALVHPDLPGEAAPFPRLCGAAVAWKTACTTASAWFGPHQVSEPVRRTLVGLLPLVALGTIADVMDLEDENRIFAAIGLRGLATTAIPGLQALVRSEAGSDVDAEAIGFRLAPMLNACGRLGHAAEALELLTTADARRSSEIVSALSQLNEERKGLERSCVESAMEAAEAAGMTRPDRRVIALANARWHEGVVGVACSRLVERFGRPTILLQDKGETLKGSGRSVPGVHLLEALRACALRGVPFRRLGGHAMAAGMEIDRAALPSFQEALIEEVNARLAPEALIPELSIDIRATLDELTRSTLSQLARLEPFGRGNPRPRFLLECVVLAAPPRQLGSSGSHVELWLRQGSGRTTRRAIWWSGAEWTRDLDTGESLDLVVEARLNRFRGREEELLTVIDMRRVSAAASVR